MVTFLVCLVVVGGASVLILRVTLEDVFQGATGDLPSVAGAPRRSLVERARDLLVATRTATPQHPELGAPHPVAAQSDTEAAPLEVDLTERVLLEAPSEVTPAVPATDRGVPEAVPTAEVVASTGPGREPDVDPVAQPVVWRGEAATSSLLVQERTVEVHQADDPEPEPHVELRPAAPAPPRLVASRPPRPSFRRRLLARIAGAVKLLALLVVVGSVLALALGAGALLFTYAMRAAIGA